MLANVFFSLDVLATICSYACWYFFD